MAASFDEIGAISNFWLRWRFRRVSMARFSSSASRRLSIDFLMIDFFSLRCLIRWCAEIRRLRRGRRLISWCFLFSRIISIISAFAFSTFRFSIISSMIFITMWVMIIFAIIYADYRCRDADFLFADVVMLSQTLMRLFLRDGRNIDFTIISRLIAADCRNIDFSIFKHWCTM